MLYGGKRGEGRGIKCVSRNNLIGKRMLPPYQIMFTLSRAKGASKGGKERIIH